MVKRPEHPHRDAKRRGGGAQATGSSTEPKEGRKRGVLSFLFKREQGNFVGQRWGENRKTGVPVGGQQVPGGRDNVQPGEC